MNNYNSVDVLCPFYKKDSREGHSLTCEGGLRGSNAMTTRFDNNSVLAKQLRNYCCRDFSRCWLFQIIRRKYE